MILGDRTAAARMSHQVLQLWQCQASNRRLRINGNQAVFQTERNIRLNGCVYFVIESNSNATDTAMFIQKAPIWGVFRYRDPY
jgi:hypothetical protein